MKFTWLKWGVLPVVVLMVSGAALAQEQSGSQSSGQPQTSPAPAAQPAPEQKSDPSIAQRKENQQDRIADGVKNGQLTAGETANLEKKEAAINGETQADRAANGGKLTAAEKAKANKQQNNLSKQIYKDKHNANTAHYGNNKVDQRREKQQKGINKQVAADRKANGGKLTAAEKKQVNHEQNQASKNIHQKKHDATTQPQTQAK